MAGAGEWGRSIQAAGDVLGPSATRGRLVYRLPVGAVLAGIYANPSGFTKGASYLEAFVQPLYVPAQELDLTIGERVGGGARVFTLNELATGQVALAEAASFLDRLGDPAALLASHLWDRANIRMIEMEAYTLIWCERLDEAQSVLGLVDNLPLSYDWERAVAERIGHVADLLASSGAQARDQLMAWREESIANLRLPTTSAQV